MRWILRILLRVCFGLRAYGLGSLHGPGPLLLIPNHVSWLDWLLVGVFLPTHWRFVVSGVTSQTSWLHRRIMCNPRTFVIDSTAPHSARSVARFLREGGCVVLFAEGRISRTGSLMKIFGGIGFLLSKTPCQVVFCHLRGAEKLKLAIHPGWRQWFPPLSVHLSPVKRPPNTSGLSARQARDRLAQWVRDQMISLQFRTEMEHGCRTVPQEIEQTARMRPRFRVLEDLYQTAISYSELIALANERSARLGSDPRVKEKPIVGLLLPNRMDYPITLLSVWCLGKTPALLNPSLGTAGVLAAIHLARIEVILSSKDFFRKLPIDLQALEKCGIHVIFIEELADITFRQKAFARYSFISPPRMRRRAFANRRGGTALILFTSGSEGSPKAVQLSHQNILANIRQMRAVSDINNTDRFFNALPLFHSLGLTVGTLFGLTRGCHVFLHPSPLQYHGVPNTVYDKNCTVLISTDTFLRGYRRRAHPYDFRTIRYLIAAGEKVHPETFREWSDTFGIRILEGYGATECSPAISANVPLACRVGSAGRFLPGIEWYLAPVDGIKEGGRLWVRGPNVMLGYLGHTGANPESGSLAGWYDTGDIVRVDGDGYLHVIGRLKRFAKIGGEMISLCAIEEAVSESLLAKGVEDACAILARSHPAKGEALLAVACSRLITRQLLRECLIARGFTNTCIPDEVFFLPRMPRLSTGKIDHQRVERLIEEHVRGPRRDDIQDSEPSSS